MILKCNCQFGRIAEFVLLFLGVTLKHQHEQSSIAFSLNGTETTGEQILTGHPKNYMKGEREKYATRERLNRKNGITNK